MGKIKWQMEHNVIQLKWQKIKNLGITFGGEDEELNQEKIEEAMIEKYSAEAVLLKRELAYKTKSLLEYQRQIEKMKPSEDLKNMIKLNTELASELRKSEDHIAYIELKHVEATPGVHAGSRLPASVKESK